MLMFQPGPQNQAQAQSNNYLQPLKMESIPETISMSLPIPQSQPHLPQGCRGTVRNGEATPQRWKCAHGNHSGLQGQPQPQVKQLHSPSKIELSDGDKLLNRPGSLMSLWTSDLICQWIPDTKSRCDHRRCTATSKTYACSFTRQKNRYDISEKSTTVYPGKEVTKKDVAGKWSPSSKSHFDTLRNAKRYKILKLGLPFVENLMTRNNQMNSTED
ncbi:hypothetical protein MJO29_000990 [Puccinia striiformis f. sp. tritici]|nr:hypothetical protein MJO29_000990 [Puccinia striiformis f. sp. tritici]